MTDQQLYENWKRRNIHNYEGTRLFAEEHGVTPAKMSEIINKYRALEEQAKSEPTPTKDELAPVKEKSKTGRKLTPEEVETIETGIKEGKPLRQLAREVGVSTNTITAYRKKLGLFKGKECVEEKDELTKLVDTLKGCKDLVCADAEMKSISASINSPESSILFETPEYTYELHIRRTPK